MPRAATCARELLLLRRSDMDMQQQQDRAADMIFHHAFTTTLTPSRRRHALLRPSAAAGRGRLRNVQSGKPVGAHVYGASRQTVACRRHHVVAHAAAFTTLCAEPMPQQPRRCRLRAAGHDSGEASAADDMSSPPFSRRCNARLSFFLSRSRCIQSPKRYRFHRVFIYARSSQSTAGDYRADARGRWFGARVVIDLPPTTPADRDANTIT